MYILLQFMYILLSFMYILLSFVYMLLPFVYILLSFMYILLHNDIYILYIETKEHVILLTNQKNVYCVLCLFDYN